ncbi:MAG TPA: autotransporter-associated beta strand repeat-containing protein [Verrucomicrobiae bacterium]|nr:autotransporter-associated beta strand repeat-containing protein [Verrucomicrobiae bacterium]
MKCHFRFSSAANRHQLAANAIILAAGFFCTALHGQTPAFPGAVGHGAFASGGRNGSIYRVTTLANSGAGSFRDGVSQPNRIIVFDVGGYMTLSSEVPMSRNLTIAGETAPGGGIAIRGAEVSTGSSTNIIIRHVRFRPGNIADSGAHCINIRGTNIILDQVSLEFGPWNNVGGVNADNLTIMRSLIADPIGQQFGAHMERIGGKITWYQNIFANGHGRQPMAKINTVFINNVVYNYQAAYDTGDTSGIFSHDVIGNYFITGPATTSAGNSWYQMNANQSFYTAGNLRDSNDDGVLNGSATAPSGVVVLASPWSPMTPLIPAASAPAAFRQTLSLAGAWPRDQVDQIILREVRSIGILGPYPLPNSQNITGLGNNGFGTINGGPLPLDTDSDGMPDFWESAVGSNANGNDALNIDASGYAAIEHYLHWLAEPHALTRTNTFVDIDLSTYTAGFTNAFPIFHLANSSNGVVSLVNGRTARFTPAAGMSGFGGFQFAVTSADGLNLTNRVSIIVSDLPTPADLVWRGDGVANVWDVGTTLNFAEGGAPVVFNSGDNVILDDSGSNSPAIQLAAPINAGMVSVVSEQDYTFHGFGFAGGTRLFKTGSGRLTLNNTNTFSAGGFINEGVLQLGDGIAMNGSISGNVTNNSTILFANPGSVNSAANFGGSGTFIKTGAGALTLSGSQSYTNLTIVESGTLEFNGGVPAGDITNNAVVALRPAGAMTYSGSIGGPGRLLTGSSGITLTLSGNNTFTGGINITSGNLRFASSSAAGFGPVTNSSSGLVYIGPDVVITNDFILTSATTDLGMRAESGVGVWAGNITVLGGGSWRPGSDGGTFVFTGAAHQGSRNFIVPRGAVHFASNAVVSATGAATALGRDSTDGNRSANITIRDNAVLELGVCSMGGGRQGGSVTLTLQNNAALSTGANSFDLHNVNRANAATTLRLNGGALTVGSFTKTRTHTNTIQFNGGWLQAGGPHGDFLPAFANQRALVQTGGARIDDNGFDIGISQALTRDPALGAAPDGGLTKIGSGAVTLSGVNSFNGPVHILEGRLKAAASSALADAGVLHVAAGAVLDVAMGGTFVLDAGRSIEGDGVVNGAFELGNGAFAKPGSNGVGTLTFDHSLTLDAGSTILMDVRSADGARDLIFVDATLIFGGTLVVTNIDPALFAAGQQFQLFEAGAMVGVFDSIQLPALGAGLAWNTNALHTSGIISVAAATAVTFNSIGRTNGNIVLTAAGGAPGGTYYLLTATNLALPLSDWIPLETNLFDGSGGFRREVPVDSLESLRVFRIRAH